MARIVQVRNIGGDTQVFACARGENPGKCHYCSRRAIQTCDKVVSTDQLQVGGKIVQTYPNLCTRRLCGQCAKHNICRIHLLLPAPAAMEFGEQPEAM